MNRRSFLKLLPVGVVAGPSVVKALASTPVVFHGVAASAFDFTFFEKQAEALAKMQVNEMLEIITETNRQYSINSSRLRLSL